MMMSTEVMGARMIPAKTAPMPTRAKAPRHAADEQGRREDASGAAAGVGEDRGRELEEAEWDEDAQSQPPIQRRPEGLVASAGHAAGPGPPQRRHGQRPGGQRAQRRARPGRDATHLLESPAGLHEPVGEE